MAKSRIWISHIDTFVDVSRPPSEQIASRDAIALLLKTDALSIEDFVKEMGLYLTTTDHVIRARGILLLGELLSCLESKHLDNTTVHSLAGFFTEKIADWHTLRGTLIGSLALLRRKSNVGVVTSSDTRSFALSFVQTVQVQILGKHERLVCFKILDCLLNHHPDVVVTLDDDFIHGTCEAIDAEKDPQCLMLTFRIVADLARIFPDPFGPLAGFAEDLFDVLGRYFPVHYTHPSDDFDVKRDDLSVALMVAFASTPLFEPFAIPLFLEKLSSSLPLAKVDSLKYLSYCSVKYGADIMAKHAKVIWYSLKHAIFSSLEDSISSRVSESPDTMDFPNNEIAKEALQCVQRFLLQEDGLFLSLILEDDDIELVLKSASSVEMYSDNSTESKQKIYALGCILWASAKISIPCCNKIFQHFFSRLMDMLGLSDKHSAQPCISDVRSISPEKLSLGVIYLCVELLAASRSLAVTSKELSPGSLSVEETWCCLLKKFSGPLTEVLHFIMVAHTTDNVSKEAIYCGVKGLQILATYPQHFSPIAESILEDILTKFTSIMTSGYGQTLLWKSALKALMEIGAFIERHHDSEKTSSYNTIVVEKAISLICRDGYDMPLQLQLEALSGIGTSGQTFMLQVTQGLEAAISAILLEATVKGHSKSVETSISLLECYCNKLLPWYDKLGAFEDVALRFTFSIWNLIECYDTFNVGEQGKELLDRMMSTMKFTVACCSQKNQGLILQKCYNVLSSSSFFLSESSYLSVPTSSDGLQLNPGLIISSSRDEWIIYLFASVVIALRPQTPVQNVRAILKLFANVLLRGHVPAAQALGSIINKLPSNKVLNASSECSLEEALDIVSNMGLSGSTLRKCSVVNGVDGDLAKSLNSGDSDLIQSNAIVGLAWIGKGLIMRGSERVKDVVMMILGCLLSSSNTGTYLLQQDTFQDYSGQHMHPDVMRSAADAFQVLLGDSDVCLSKRFHAMMKPLYKQHFFSSMMPVLLTSLKDSDSSGTRMMLYRALGHVISNTPLAAVVMEAKALIFVLLDGISILSVDALDRDLTYSLLLVLSGMIMNENGRVAVTENAHIIINRLVGLVAYPHMMLVRETAVQCLVAMSGLPHTRIFSMRTQVLHAVSKSLDDPKRSVRQEAVRCRQAWASIA